MIETSRAPTDPARTSEVQRSGAGAFVRIMHPPGGSFDVIVTHSGDRPEIPGVVRGLSGSPVYSAYIPVGDEREWVLAYCLPASQPARDSRYTVYVEAAAPLSAPFPITTVVRAAIAATMRPTPIAFHGFLTSAGTFRDMQPEQPTPATLEIAGTLDEWRFRPARRGNTPIEVEVLLILPATTDRSDGPSLRGSAWRPGRSSYPEAY